MSSRVNNDLRALKDDDTGIVAVPPQNKINLGKSGTSNEGITWFGSSYVGPGNLLTDQEGHFIGKALPTSAIDKVAFQHDADYFNATDVSKDNIWEIDKKAIKSALQVSDPYLGNYATAIGLVLKRGADLVDQFVTGNQTAIYPNHPNTSGKFFDPTPYINNSGVEEDPDLDWSYDGNGDPNVVPGTPEPVASSSSNHVGPTEEYWSGGTDTMATTGGGTKRGADSSSGSGSAPKRANTSLPGTGNEGAGDPDTGNPSPENAVIPRPISNTGGFTMVFRKVHTFISYGAAWKVVKHPGSNSAYFGTTSLMNVPVDQPWFYMSPSEFKVLPRGALCTSVRCRGVMRNPRTAFETNSSTSSLATLNQNKFMVKADGLNLSTRGVNRTLHFGNNTEPMDVTATEAYENHTLSYIEKMYGQTIDGQFKVSEGHCLPASYMNLPLMYNSYFCNFVNTGHNLGRMGWERFNEKITKVDASFTVGTTVVDYEYKPQCGLLTPQHDPFFDGLVSVQEPDTGAFHSFGLQNSNLEIIDDIDANSATVQRRTDNKLNHFGNTAWKRMFGNARYYTPIDCGQYVRQWDKNNHSSSVQPSVHVGVYPVHKLTTSTNSIVPVSFTDIECTWDFETEMTVSFGCPQSRVAFDRLHVEYEKSWMVPEDHFNQNMYYRGDLSVVHGKYVAPTKVSQPNASNTVTEKELTHGGTVRTLAQMNEANLDATTAAPSRK